jgi:cysteinyl-tRNA synthetase
MLMIYNSMTKNKEAFIPLVPNQISMYVCGVTVYDHCHLGHARCMIVFDMMVKYFRHLGYQVKFVRNITDIDDKIIKRAQEKNVSFDAISLEFAQSMKDDAKSLGLNAPDVEPLATEHIQDMIEIIQKLIEKGKAYIAKSGDVCFSVNEFASYGKLSRQDLKQLVSGARIDIDEGKHSPLDFVLWKRVKPGEPSWSSPWGQGRPGWHIECSAMAMHHLGPQIDIHGGGLDLQFPHHENEIAQSEACTGHTYANYWMHVGLLQLNQEKMAKSTGNFLSIKDALKKYHPEVLKLFFMTSHYRSPLNLSDELVTQSHKALRRLYQCLAQHQALLKEQNIPLSKEWVERFESRMNDDLNTSEAVSILFELCTQINKTPTASLITTLKYLADIIGLLEMNPEEFLKHSMSEEGISNAEIEQLIEERKNARLQKQYQRADEIRLELLKQGVELEDSALGTNWKRLVD